jgi:3-dehydroquinate synthase
MTALRTVVVDAASGRCPIEIARGLVRHVGNGMVAVGLRPVRAAVVHDSGVPLDAFAAVEDSLRAASIDPVRIGIAGGESGKSLEAVAAVAARMLDAGIDRTGAVVAVGGGVVGDVAGFVAATYMRGVACVQVPTTLLAMVDASVGGKTAVNLQRTDGSIAKNAVGAFAQPRLVACDPEVLGTLPGRELRSGLAECVKHGVVADRAMLAWIRARADRLLAHDPDTLGELVERNVRIKAEVVSRDEREAGPREALNLGHTFAHAIEAMLHAQCTHGEAVGIGMVAACTVVRELGAEGAGELEAEVRETLGTLGLPVRMPAPRPVAALRAAMDADKKRRGGALRLVLPFGPDDVRTLAGVPETIVERAWRAVGAA